MDHQAASSAVPCGVDSVPFFGGPATVRFFLSEASVLSSFLAYILEALELIRASGDKRCEGAGSHTSTVAFKEAGISARTNWICGIYRQKHGIEPTILLGR